MTHLTHSDSDLQCTSTADRSLRRQRTDSAHAFSLVELLVVIAIIAILVALVVVGFRRVRVAAARTESVNALRQMVVGYLSYVGDNKDMLMPGYVDFGPATPEGLLRMNAKFANGKWVAPYQGENPTLENEHQNLSSYVWRLSPYLDHSWRTVMMDYRDSAAMSQFSSQFDQGVYGPADIGGNTIATAPSYGLNSIFFGGDDRHGEDDMSPWGPNSANRLAATRQSEILNGSAIVFAPAAAAGTSAEVYANAIGVNGYMELRPPFIEFDASAGMWVTRQWELGSGTGILHGPDLHTPAGLPIIRHGGEMIPVARYNGSTGSMNIGELATNMRNWDPRQTGTEVPPADLP